MRQGQSLAEFAQQLTEERARQKDLVADTDRISIDDGRMFVGECEYGMTEHARGQLLQHAKVPKRFADLMRSGTERERRALDEAVNARLHENRSKRLVRAYHQLATSHPDGDGATVRAVLSNRYRRLDNLELMEAVLPVLYEAPDMRVLSCQVTPNRCYLKAVFPRIEGEVALGDVVQSGIAISNSEVGNGALKIQPLIFRPVCTNGLISETAMKRNHVGRNVGSGAEVEVLYRDETLEADDRAFWLKVQDVVRASIDEAQFELLVNGMKRASGLQIDNPVGTVEVLADRYQLTENESSGVLGKLIAGDSMLHRHGTANTLFGLVQAITAYSQDVEDYARATQFEALGGQVLNMTPNEWGQFQAQV